MEREGEVSSGEPSRTAEEEQSRISEKKRVIMAVTRILDSGTLDEKSLRLLEQLADCVQCPQAEVTREAEPIKQAAAQQATPARGEPVETEVERVVAAKEARERETNASGQLTAPEAAGRRETKEPCPMETAESTGARETTVPEERSAAVREMGSR
jgi:D-alanyl-D-alanine carboxypeptidase